MPKRCCLPIEKRTTQTKTNQISSPWQRRSRQIQSSAAWQD